ncbi:MAG TPA: sigma-70 family RNA polymerase sigma factor [Candidatus Binataceae bacterium]|nr:sigma-70 family RNA polymerase sigma factor [Candidatus Binataceae bacterium]
MTVESLEQFRHQHQSSIERLYLRSGAEKWNLSEVAFAEALHRSYARRQENGPAFASSDQIDAFLDSLFVDDLALAAACREGNENAWRHFLASYRAVTEGAARALISDSSAARELADSLYADLYGLRQNNGARNSPLDRYHGRSPLSAWLRTVIARRAADVWRATKITEPMDDAAERSMNHAAHEPQAPHDPRRGHYLAMLCDSLKNAIAKLPPSDRLRISYYYLQELTLAQIGSLTGEHESTISRKLAQTRTRIREEVERNLSCEYHLSADQISLCFEYATEDWPFNLAEVLAQAK